MDEYETARRVITEAAFALASSGTHTSHRTILAALEENPDYSHVREVFDSPGVRKQLDMICADVAKRMKRNADRA